MKKRVVDTHDTFKPMSDLSDACVFLPVGVRPDYISAEIAEMLRIDFSGRDYEGVLTPVSMYDVLYAMDICVGGFIFTSSATRETKKKFKLIARRIVSDDRLDYNHTCREHPIPPIVLLSSVWSQSILEYMLDQQERYNPQSTYVQSFQSVSGFYLARRLVVERILLKSLGLTESCLTKLLSHPKCSIKLADIFHWVRGSHRLCITVANLPDGHLAKLDVRKKDYIDILHKIIDNRQTPTDLTVREYVIRMSFTREETHSATSCWPAIIDNSDKLCKNGLFINTHLPIAPPARRYCRARLVDLALGLADLDIPVLVVLAIFDALCAYPSEFKPPLVDSWEIAKLVKQTAKSVREASEECELNQSDDAEQ